MTRDEFIDWYMDRSNLGSKTRTPDGFRAGEHKRVALPCNCGEDECLGWAMIPDDPESIDDHIRLYGPEVGGQRS